MMRFDLAGVTINEGTNKEYKKKEGQMKKEEYNEKLAEFNKAFNASIGDKGFV